MSYVDPDIALVREMLNAPDSHVSDVRMSKANASLDRISRFRERIIAAIGHGARSQDSDSLLIAQVHAIRRVLDEWSGIGFDFWICDDEWAAQEPGHDDERDWSNLSAQTRAALGATEVAKAERAEMAKEFPL